METSSRRRTGTDASTRQGVADRPRSSAPGAVVVMVPGYTGSGPRHWQTLWEREHPEYHRVEQADWNHPDMEDWIATLNRYLARLHSPVVLVGHSCGALTVVHWSVRRGPGPVVAALLVAPADADAPEPMAAVRAFAPLPAERLPFPSLLVSSDNDPHLPLERARELAATWGSRLEVVPGAGHLNTASGYGVWPEGKRFLAYLCTQATAPPVKPSCGSEG